MSLQDLVTEHSPEPEETADDFVRDLTPSEILSGVDRMPSVQYLIDLADQIANGDFQKVPRFAAWLSFSRYHLHSWPITAKKLLWILFSAEDAATGDLDAAQWVQEQFEIFRDGLIRGELDRKRAAAIGSFEKSLAYLQETFGDNLRDILAELCGVSLSTASSWIQGRKPRPTSIWNINHFTKQIFSLREEGGVSPEELSLWIKAPLESGNTPLELWIGSPAKLDSELVESMRDLRSG